MALLISERHLADSFDAGLDGVALGHVDGAQHAHFQIRSWISHLCLVAFFSAAPGVSAPRRQFLLTLASLRRHGPGGAVPCGVVAGWENLDRRPVRSNSARHRACRGGFQPPPLPAAAEARAADQPQPPAGGTPVGWLCANRGRPPGPPGAVGQERRAQWVHSKSGR